MLREGKTKGAKHLFCFQNIHKLNILKYNYFILGKKSTDLENEICLVSR